MAKKSIKKKSARKAGTLKAARKSKKSSRIIITKRKPAGEGPSEPSARCN